MSSVGDQGFTRIFTDTDSGSLDRSKLEERRKGESLIHEPSLKHEVGIKARDVSKMNFVEAFFAKLFGHTVEWKGKTYLVGERSFAAYMRRNQDQFQSIAPSAGDSFKLFTINSALKELKNAKVRERVVDVTKDTVKTVLRDIGVTSPQTQSKIAEELLGGKERGTIDSKKFSDVIGGHRKDINLNSAAPQIKAVVEGVVKHDVQKIEKAVDQLATPTGQALVTTARPEDLQLWAREPKKVPEGSFHVTGAQLSQFAKDFLKLSQNQQSYLERLPQDKVFVLSREEVQQALKAITSNNSLLSTMKAAEGESSVKVEDVTEEESRSSDYEEAGAAMGRGMRDAGAVIGRGLRSLVDGLNKFLGRDEISRRTAAYEKFASTPTAKPTEEEVHGGVVTKKSSKPRFMQLGAAEVKKQKKMQAKEAAKAEKQAKKEEIVSPEHMLGRAEAEVKKAKREAARGETVSAAEMFQVAEGEVKVERFATRRTGLSQQDVGDVKKGRAEFGDKISAAELKKQQEAEEERQKKIAEQRKAVVDHFVHAKKAIGEDRALQGSLGKVLGSWSSDNRAMSALMSKDLSAVTPEEFEGFARLVQKGYEQIPDTLGMPPNVRELISNLRAAVEQYRKLLKG